MKQSTAVLAVLLGTMLSMGTAAPGRAGERRSAAVIPYEGRITAIEIDTCGLAPGLCERSITLAQDGGGQIALAIRVGTWIKRGERFLTILDLAVGDDVRVQTFRMPGEALPRVAIIEFTTP
jgi:hypothetical protein